MVLLYSVCGWMNPSNSLHLQVNNCGVKLFFVSFIVYFLKEEIERGLIYKSFISFQCHFVDEEL